MYDVIVFEGELSAPSLDIPNLDGVVARGASKDVLGGGVEKDMANLPALSLDVVVCCGCWTESYLMCPESLATGATSAGSSASVQTVKLSGTFQMKTYFQ